jgi:hypothetical protein
MQMVASRCPGRAALRDLRPIRAPYYPSAFTSCRFDPTVRISSLDDVQAVAETLISTSSVALSGNAFRTNGDQGPWNERAMAPDMSAIRR